MNENNSGNEILFGRGSGGVEGKPKQQGELVQIKMYKYFGNGYHIQNVIIHHYSVNQMKYFIVQV